MFYNAFAGILRAIGDTFSSLMFLILACGLNIILDLYFILKLNMGVGELVSATVILRAICYTL